MFGRMHGSCAAIHWRSAQPILLLLQISYRKHLVAEQVVKLKAFQKFENTTEALAAATSIGDSKLSKGRICSSPCVDAVVRTD